MLEANRSYHHLKKMFVFKVWVIYMRFCQSNTINTDLKSDSIPTDIIYNRPHYSNCRSKYVSGTKKQQK